MSVILITGATGAIGTLLVEACCDRDYAIRTLSIDPPRSKLWPDGVETIIGNVTDESVVMAAMEGVDSVIHLAALLHIINPSSALQEKYEYVNVRGTETIVKAAMLTGVRRVVFFSTISVYGASNGKILTEDSAPKPASFYAQTKFEAEKYVLDAKDADGRKIGIVLRPGAVYGSFMKGNYQRLVNSLANGRFIPVGKGNNRRTLVYEKDMAQAALLALEHPAAAGKIFNVSDGHFHTMNDIILAICQALNRKPPGLSLPIGPARFVAGVVEDIFRLISRQPLISRAMIDKYTEDVAVDSTRFQKDLGFVPRYDLSAGWHDAIQSMRKNGEL
jgi:UDP-glucose 4-epimerase